MGQKPPMRQPLFQDVEDGGVEDIAQGGVGAGSSLGFWGRQIRLQKGPLGIGEVGWICLSLIRDSVQNGANPHPYQTGSKR